MKQKLNDSRVVKWLERWSPILFVPLCALVVISIIVGVLTFVRLDLERTDRIKEDKALIVQLQERDAKQQQGLCGFANSIGQLRPKTIPTRTDSGVGITDTLQEIVNQSNVMETTFDCPTK